MQVETLKVGKKGTCRDYLLLLEEMWPMRFESKRALIVTPRPSGGRLLGAARRRGVGVIEGFAALRPGSAAGVWIMVKDPVTYRFAGVTHRGLWRGEYRILAPGEVEEQLLEEHGLRVDLSGYEYDGYLVFEVEELAPVEPPVPLEALRRVVAPLQDALLRRYALGAREKVFMKVFDSRGHLTRAHIRYIPPEAAEQLLEKYPQLAVTCPK